MESDRPAIVPPEDTVPPGVVLQSFMDDSGGLRTWLASLAATLRRLLRR